MRTIGVKGSIAVITAGAVMLLLLLTITSMKNANDNGTAMINMVSAKETAFKAENLLRILDKSVSKAIIDTTSPSNCNPGSVTEESIQTKFANAVGGRNDDVGIGFNDLNSKLMNCTAVVKAGSLRINGNQLDINGTMSCTTTIGETTITDERSFRFSKEIRTNAIDSSCEVYDTVSECMEQPS